MDDRNCSKPTFSGSILGKIGKTKSHALGSLALQIRSRTCLSQQSHFRFTRREENYIRNWLEERVGVKAEFRISFPGKFSRERRSIIPAGDTSQFIPSKDADIDILEEPEHLNWYHHGKRKRWTDKFNHVVGMSCTREKAEKKKLDSRKGIWELLRKG